MTRSCATAPLSWPGASSPRPAPSHRTESAEPTSSHSAAPRATMNWPPPWRSSRAADGPDSLADLCHVLFTLNEFIYID